MTKEQIDYILDNIGESQDTWITMEKYYNMLALKNDTSIRFAPKTRQIYFDSTNEVAYVRYTDGNLIKATGIIPPRYVAVNYQGEGYYVKLVPGYKTYNGIDFHHVLKYEIIDAFLLRE